MPCNSGTPCAMPTRSNRAGCGLPSCELRPCLAVFLVVIQKKQRVISGLDFYCAVQHGFVVKKVLRCTATTGGICTRGFQLDPIFFNELEAGSSLSLWNH